MQFSSKIIIRYLFIVPSFILLLSSCLKKVDEVDELNSNIFDREYDGEIWYVIKDGDQVTNGLGEIKARLLIWIPKANLPGLVPSNLKIQAEGDGLAPTIYDFPLTTGGDFERSIDLPYTGSGEYCVKLGIYLEEDAEAINIFEDCITI